ncbi:Uncharacterised protein g3099 [Pycnogonum litorale]
MYRLATTVLLSCLLCFTDGFECFSCVGSGNNSTCQRDPRQVKTGSPIIICHRKYCTIVRQELAQIPGKVQSFRRGCDVTGSNAVIRDSGFVTFYRACSESLCNGGDGLPGNSRKHRRNGSTISGRTPSLVRLIEATLAVLIMRISLT